jgi:hypothetical protein
MQDTTKVTPELSELSVEAMWFRSFEAMKAWHSGRSKRCEMRPEPPPWLTRAVPAPPPEPVLSQHL